MKPKRFLGLTKTGWVTFLILAVTTAAVIYFWQ